MFLACGARSGLPAGADGHPASTTASATTSTTTSASTTGTGGAPTLVCHLLQLIVTVDDLGLGDVVQPNLVTLSTSPTTFDIEHLGDTLVIGQIVEMSSSAPQLRVRSWTDNGPTWSVNIPVEGAVAGPVELLTSDGLDSILVAWSELPPGAAFHRVRRARLDCTP